MKVLWYCNVLLPKAAEAAKIKGEINTAGWIEGFLNQIWSDYKCNLHCITEIPNRTI